MVYTMVLLVGGEASVLRIGPRGSRRPRPSPGPGPLALRRRAAGRGRSRRSGVSAPRNRRIANRIRSPGAGHGSTGRRGSWPETNRNAEADRKASPGKRIRILRKTMQNSNGNECGVRRSTPGALRSCNKPRQWHGPGHAIPGDQFQPFAVPQIPRIRTGNVSDSPRAASVQATDVRRLQRRLPMCLSRAPSLRAHAAACWPPLVQRRQTSLAARLQCHCASCVACLAHGRHLRQLHLQIRRPRTPHLCRA